MHEMDEADIPGRFVPDSRDQCGFFGATVRDEEELEELDPFCERDLLKPPTSSGDGVATGAASDAASVQAAAKGDTGSVHTGSVAAQGDSVYNTSSVGANAGAASVAKASSVGTSSVAPSTRVGANKKDSASAAATSDVVPGTGAEEKDGAGKRSKKRKEMPNTLGEALDGEYRGPPANAPPSEFFDCEYHESPKGTELFTFFGMSATAVETPCVFFKFSLESKEKLAEISKIFMPQFTYVGFTNGKGDRWRCDRDIKSCGFRYKHREAFSVCSRTLNEFHSKSSTGKFFSPQGSHESLMKMDEKIFNWHANMVKQNVEFFKTLDKELSGTRL